MGFCAVGPALRGCAEANRSAALTETLAQLKAALAGRYTLERGRRDMGRHGATAREKTNARPCYAQYGRTPGTLATLRSSLRRARSLGRAMSHRVPASHRVPRFGGAD
jgi:hypothetical protein